MATIAPSIEWRLIHQAADKAMPKLRDGLITAFALIRVPDVVRHEGDVSLLEFTGELRRVFRSQLAVVYAQGGAIAIKGLPEPRRQFSSQQLHMPDSFAVRQFAEYVFSFDIHNPRVSTWLDQHAAAQVAEVSESIRTAIRSLIKVGYDQGIPPVATARNLRMRVGLTVQQQGYIDRFQEQLEGQGYQPDHIAAKVEQYRKSWIKFRSETIARTETINGATAGQQEGWEQAVDIGRLSKEEFQQGWIITPDDRLCRRCFPMRGERAPIGGVFVGNLKGPTLHPR